MITTMKLSRYQVPEGAVRIRVAKSGRFGKTLKGSVTLNTPSVNAHVFIRKNPFGHPVITLIQGEDSISVPLRLPLEVDSVRLTRNVQPSIPESWVRLSSYSQTTLQEVTTAVHAAIRELRAAMGV